MVGWMGCSPPLLRLMHLLLGLQTNLSNWSPMKSLGRDFCFESWMEQGVPPVLPC